MLVNVLGGKRFNCWMLMAVVMCVDYFVLSPMAGAAEPVVHKELWPSVSPGIPYDAKVEAFVESLLAKLTVAEKVGQMVQADVSTITPDEVREFALGSVLAGGNSAPNKNLRGPAQEWIGLTQSYAQVMAESTNSTHLAIPLLFGIDAVHGHGHLRGATIFPHNIGLGAAHDPELVRLIGNATAQEVRATGIDWAFAPTLAVAQDTRWGRTYESYSEDPTLVAAYARQMILGLQDDPSQWAGSSSVIATAKHFLGDGGTRNGRDQGETLLAERTLVQKHAPGYAAALSAGSLTVMASYSSWNGRKMHDNAELLTDVLKGRMGFRGFVIGDWNGQEQVPGCTKFDCPQAIIAGVDMMMAADGWKRFLQNTLREVNDGAIPLTRVDDAVRRILRVKVLSGLFDRGNAASQATAAGLSVLGAPEHRAIARRAVRESLVLLKNQRGLLPLRANSRVLVVGSAADNVGQQSGGWTVDWQGDHNQNADFPGATSLYAGLRDALAVGGGSAEFSTDGRFTQRPDVAVVVFGEQPYAEYDGDREDTRLALDDAHGLAQIRQLRAAKIPVVALLLTGRPLYVQSEIQAANAFVVAWLPGSEGGGVADVLIRKPDGAIHYDFTGRLSFSWPATLSPALSPAGLIAFKRGAGLHYSSKKPLATPRVPSHLTPVDYQDRWALFTEGHVVAPLTLLLRDPVAELRDTMSSVTSQGKLLNVSMTEQGAHVTWSGGGAGEILIGGRLRDLSKPEDRDLALRIQYRVNSPASEPVYIGIRCGLPYGVTTEEVPGTARRCGLKEEPLFDVTELFSIKSGFAQSVDLPLRCLSKDSSHFRDVAAQFLMRTVSALDLVIADIRYVHVPDNQPCPRTLDAEDVNFRSLRQ